MKSKGFLTPVLVALVMLALSPIPSTVVGASEVPVSITPHRIILNAAGQWESVDALIDMRLPSGYSILDFAIVLWFGEEYDEALAFWAFDLEYCYIDSNFFAAFNRQEIQDDADVWAIAGYAIPTTVEGYYRAINADGVIVTCEFRGYDLVDLLAPSKSTSIRN